MEIFKVSFVINKQTFTEVIEGHKCEANDISRYKLMVNSTIKIWLNKNNISDGATKITDVKIWVEPNHILLELKKWCNQEETVTQKNEFENS